MPLKLIQGKQIATASWAVNALTASYLSGYIESSSYAINAATASNILGGKATHIPYFITDTTLATSSIFQSGSTSVIINQDSNTTANPEALYVWQPHPTSINVVSGKGNLNNYLQLNIHNTNQGTNASSDIVATANNGDENSNYIDMGINSENYSGVIGGSNDAYLYSAGQHLHIGNTNPTKPIQFFVGGADSDLYRKFELNSNGQHNMTGSLEISGGLKVNQGITGSLFGTSSWAISSSYSIRSTSASYALSSSQAISASNSLTASYVNPLRQNLQLTGSFSVSGSTTQIGNNNILGNTLLSGSIGIVGNSTLTGSFLVSGSTTQIGTNNLLGNTTLSGSIIISGSDNPSTPTIRVYGDMQTDGVIKFMPVSKNINTSISASYIFVSGSTNDLYFSQNGNGYSNISRLRWLEGNLYTGLLNGGILSISSSTVFNVSSGSGMIVNLNGSYNDNPYPTVQYVNWGNISSSIASLSASFDQSFVAINSASAIEVKGTPFEDGEYNTKIPLGIVIHQNHSTINAVQTFPSLAYGWKQRSFDFIKAFGPLKISGYTLSPSASSAGGLLLGGGVSWVDGRNYTVDPNNPSYITEAVGISTSKVYRYYQSGSQWGYDTNGGAGYTSIDPTNYSLNGVLTPVATNDWSIQRVFYFPNSATKALYIYYGNSTYSNKDLALAAINTESFTEAPNTAANSIFIGYILVRYNANFTVAASYTIQPAGLFRSAGLSGGGGGGGTTLPGGATTQIQYNNAGAFGGVPNLTWDGTTLRATGSFSGSITNSVSASYALTASYALNAGGGATFPYTGSAKITGSLVVTGSTTSTQGFIKPGAGSEYLLADGTTTVGTGGSAFPYTGSARITGSLSLIGPATITGSLINGAQGNTASGLYSHAEGRFTVASGDYSHAEGAYTIAQGNYSHAEGVSTTSSGTVSHAEGEATIAIGDYSHAEGNNTLASGSYSHAEGYLTLALGVYSHAEGGYQDEYGSSNPGGTASGPGSHAEGQQTVASGLGSHAEGGFVGDPGTGTYYFTISQGTYSHAEGGATLASGIYSHAEGLRTTAQGLGSHAEGGFQDINGDIHPGGYAQGAGSHAEGLSTSANGVSSHAEGEGTISTGYASHAEGSQATSQGTYSHAEGDGTLASGVSAHAEGTGAVASGNGAHAEGVQTEAYGYYSHAEGINTIALGYASHAEGLGTIASGDYQHVQGRYNIPSTVESSFTHGNGIDDADRSNLIYAHDNIVEITGSLNVSGSINLNGSSITGGGGGSAFPYTGTAQITGSLIVTSTIQLDGSLTDYASVNSTIVGSNNLYTQPTGSYTAAFVKYTVSNGTNSRAGEFIVNWNDSLPVEFTDISTRDIGNTTDVVFSSTIVSSQIQVNATTATSGWKIKTLATFI